MREIKEKPERSGFDGSPPEKVTMAERRGAAIMIANLRKEYGALSKRVVGLDGVDFANRPREFVGLVGPSGCGKSTLLRILAGLDTATSGSIDVEAAGWPVQNAMVFQES